MALGVEIQAVQAVQAEAFELELNGDAQGAANAYLKAATQAQYLLDVCVPQTQAAGDLAAVVGSLLHTCGCRLEVCLRPMCASQRVAVH
mgnify:CR=1 FL=1